MNLIKQLRVPEPGSKVRLADIDPGFNGKHAYGGGREGRAQGQPCAYHRAAAQAVRQPQPLLLIVLQGIDGAGKDGTCWHVISALDPQGVNVVGFKQPTAEERDHDFLWRVHPHAPELGRVAIFNRSHSEDVLVARVHSLVAKKVWKPRFDFINEWEKLLVSDKNTHHPEILPIHFQS